MGSYETTCALPKAGKVTQQSVWDFNSVMWHPSDKEAALHYDTCGDQAMSPFVYGGFRVRTAASACETVKL